MPMFSAPLPHGQLSALPGLPHTSFLRQLWHLRRWFSLLLLALLCWPAWAERLTVAHVAPLSGLEATRGRAYAAGLALAFNPVNKGGGVGGHTLQLVSADDHGRAEDTLTEVRRLLAEHKPLVLTGLVGNESVLALLRAGVLEQERLPVLGLRTLGLDVEHPLVFSLQAPTQQELAKIFEQLATVGFKRVALLHEEGARSVVDSVQALVARNAGMSLVAKAGYPAGTARSTAAAEQLAANASVQAVVMVASGPAAAAFIEGYRTAGGTAQLFAHSGADIEQLAKRLAEEHTRGLAITQVVPNPYKINLRLTREFNEAYRAAQAEGTASGLPVSYSMMEGYLAGRVLVEAVRKLGPRPSREALVAALEGLAGLDLGGLRLGFGPGVRTGLRLVELSIVNSEGRIRQ